MLNLSRISGVLDCWLVRYINYETRTPVIYLSVDAAVTEATDDDEMRCPVEAPADSNPLPVIDTVDVEKELDEVCAHMLV